MTAYDLLTPAQAASTRRVLAEELPRRRHLVVSLSGGHAYGFPSPDSDVDIKCVHVQPTAQLVGLRPVIAPAERLEIVDGVEIDYSSNEIAGVLAGVLQGNGNYIERIIGHCFFESSADHAALQPLVRGCLSRRVHRHYRGFAQSQRIEFEKSRKVKRALYVLRTALTGTHLLRSGEVVTDVTRLIDDAGFGEAWALVRMKQQGELVQMDEAAFTHWSGVIGRAFEVLDQALAASVLPEEPQGVEALEAWLVELRRRNF